MDAIANVSFGHRSAFLKRLQSFGSVAAKGPRWRKKAPLAWFLTLTSIIIHN